MHLEYTRVLSHERIGAAYRQLDLASSLIAPRVQPGQFVHLRVPNLGGAVLRRPFSVYRAGRDSLSILYKCVGLGTEAMAGLQAGAEVSLLGPLGNGFPTEEPGFPVLVAGGYGMAALYLVARTLPSPGAVFVGGATAPDILCVDEFKALGWPVHVATEDGSCGIRGRVTDALDPWMDGPGAGKPWTFFACGPNGMLRAVGDRAIARGRPGWLSMDRHMGCGVGACLACVQRIRDPGHPEQERWSRVCRDGPVFECREIVWED